MIRRLLGVRGRIDSAAEWAARSGGEAVYERLRPAEAIRRRPSRTLAGEPHPALARLEEHVHPETFRLRLRGGRLAGEESLLLSRDRRAFAQSLFSPDHLAASAPFAARRLPPRRRARGTHLTIATPWTYAHYHWMLDALPRLALLPLDDLADAPLIVPARLTALQRETLARAGVAPDRLRPFDHTHLLVDELVWPSLAGRTGNPPRWVVEWLRERLAPPPAAPGTRRRRLYVSRADVDRRRVVNEPEVVAALAERGFETVAPGELPLGDQLALFASAEAVVGAHGGALVNLLAARAATVVELFEPGYVNGCYYALCDAAGHEHWHLVAEPAGDGDLRVDVERLVATVDAALARPRA